MRTLTKMRRWINRDDGRHFQVRNRAIGALEVTGLLVFVGALALWQLHAKIGISSLWALGTGLFGLFLVLIAHIRESDDDA